MATPAALEPRPELCIENERGSGRRRMKSYNKGGEGMFEDQRRKNKTEQSQEDRNVYFGVITHLLEETTTSHLPPSFRRSPPSIQLHLRTSRSSSSPLSLQGCCFSVSVSLLHHIFPLPSITISRFNTPLGHFSIGLSPVTLSK